jgi:hypothetical protein
LHPRPGKSALRAGPLHRILGRLGDMDPGALGLLVAISGILGPHARPPDTGASGVDPLDEPAEDSRPDLVLADQVFDPVFKIGIVVDLDDDDRTVGFLDVDAI